MEHVRIGRRPVEEQDFMRKQALLKVLTVCAHGVPLDAKATRIEQGVAEFGWEATISTGLGKFKVTVDLVEPNPEVTQMVTTVKAEIAQLEQREALAELPNAGPVGNA